MQKLLDAAAAEEQLAKADLRAAEESREEVHQKAIAKGGTNQGIKVERLWATLPEDYKADTDAAAKIRQAEEMLRGIQEEAQKWASDAADKAQKEAAPAPGAEHNPMEVDSAARSLVGDDEFMDQLIGACQGSAETGEVKKRVAEAVEAAAKRAKSSE